MTRLSSLAALAGLLVLLTNPPVRERTASGAAPVPRGPRDVHGDPLPAGAVARIGTVRLRSATDIDRAALSPDGRTLVTLGGDLQVWDARTGSLLRTIPMVEHPFPGDERLKTSEEVAAVAFVTATGKFHVLTRKGILRACDLADGKWSAPLARTAGPVPDRNLMFCWGRESPDGTHFFYDPQIDPPRVEVFALGKDKPVLELKGERLAACGFASHFTADNKLVALTRKGATVTTMRDAGGREAVTTFTGSDPHSSSFVLSRDGALATGLFAPNDEERSPYPLRTLVVWDGKTGKEKFRVAGWRPRLIGFTHDGTKLLAHEYGELVIAATATGKVTNRIKGHGREIRSANFSADGKYLVTCGGRDRSAIVWDLAAEKPACDIDAPRGPVKTIAFSPDGRTVFTSTRRNTPAGSGTPSPESANTACRPTSTGAPKRPRSPQTGITSSRGTGTATRRATRRALRRGCGV